MRLGLVHCKETPEFDATYDPIVSVKSEAKKTPKFDTTYDYR